MIAPRKSNIYNWLKLWQPSHIWNDMKNDGRKTVVVTRPRSELNNRLISMKPKTEYNQIKCIRVLMADAQKNVGSGSTCFRYSHTHFCWRLRVALGPLSHNTTDEKKRHTKCKKKERCETLRISIRSHNVHMGLSRICKSCEIQIDAAIVRNLWNAFERRWKSLSPFADTTILYLPNRLGENTQIQTRIHTHQHLK